MTRLPGDRARQAVKLAPREEPMTCAEGVGVYDGPGEPAPLVISPMDGRSPELFRVGRQGAAG